MVDSGLAYYEEQMAEASMNAGDVMTLEEIDGLGSFADYIQYQAGAFLPSLATSVAGGGIGGFAVEKGVEKKIKDKVADRAKQFAEKRVGKDLQVAKRKELRAQIHSQSDKVMLSKAQRRQDRLPVLWELALQCSLVRPLALSMMKRRDLPWRSSWSRHHWWFSRRTSRFASASQNPSRRSIQTSDRSYRRHDQQDPKRFNQVMNALKKSEVGNEAPIEGVTEAMQEYVQEVAIKYVDSSFSLIWLVLWHKPLLRGAHFLFTQMLRLLVL